MSPSCRQYDTDKVEVLSIIRIGFGFELAEPSILAAKGTDWKRLNERNDNIWE